MPAFFWSLFHFVVLPFFMWHRLISINNINTFSMGEFHTTFLLEHNKGLKRQNFDFRAQFLTICTLILEAPVLHVREQLWAFVCYWCCWWFFLCRNVFLLYLQHNHTWQQYQLHKKEKCRKNLGIGTGKAWSFFSLTHCNKIWHYSHQNSIAMAYQSS